MILPKRLHKATRSLIIIMTLLVFYSCEDAATKRETIIKEEIAAINKNVDKLKASNKEWNSEALKMVVSAPFSALEISTGIENGGTKNTSNSAAEVAETTLDRLDNGKTIKLLKKRIETLELELKIIRIKTD